MMKSVLSAHSLPAVAFGLLFATLGFTFAFATSDDGGSASRGVGAPRAFGSACVRPPVTIVTDGDLGLVLTGTEFHRQILAVNGFKPHQFSFTSKPASKITLSNAGEYFGVQTIAFDACQIAVTDNAGKKNQQIAIKDFIVEGEDPVTSPVALHFLNAPTLPVAVASSEYNVTIQVNGGTPPYSFEQTADTDINAIPQGLNIRTADANDKFGSETLLLFGKLLAPTTATFTLVATDGAGARVSRTFSLTVLPGTISSDFLASAGSFTLAFGKGKKDDKLSLSILLNKTDLATGGIRTQSDLNGVPFSLKIGGTAFSLSKLAFDRHGMIQVPPPGTFPSKGLTTAKITLNPKSGLFKAQVGAFSLIPLIKGDSRFFRTIIPFSIQIGQAAASSSGSSGSGSASTSTSVTFDKTDVVQFTYRRSPSTGKGNASKNQKLAPAGIFILTKVKGTEIREGAADVMTLNLTGDIRQPGGKPIVANPTDTVEILLGNGPNACIGNFPASSFLQTGDTLSFTNTDTKFAIKSVMIDNKKGTFVISTNPFAVRDVFGVDILTADIPNVLTLTLNIAGADGKTTTFDGQTSAGVFRRGTKLINK